MVAIPIIGLYELESKIALLVLSPMNIIPLCSPLMVNTEVPLVLNGPYLISISPWSDATALCVCEANKFIFPPNAM